MKHNEVLLLKLIFSLLNRFLHWLSNIFTLTVAKCELNSPSIAGKIRWKLATWCWVNKQSFCLWEKLSVIPIRPEDNSESLSGHCFPGSQQKTQTLRTWLAYCYCSCKISKTPSTFVSTGQPEQMYASQDGITNTATAVEHQGICRYMIAGKLKVFGCLKTQGKLLERFSLHLNNDLR